MLINNSGITVIYWYMALTGSPFGPNQLSNPVPSGSVFTITAIPCTYSISNSIVH